MTKRLPCAQPVLVTLFLLATVSPVLRAADEEAAPVSERARPFKHPGLPLSREELDLIKGEVNNAAANPSESVRLRKLGWEEMMTTRGLKLFVTLPNGGKTAKWVKFSDLDYPPHAKEQIVADGGVSENFSTDAWAAYCHALQWVVKGNQANADKAIEILNAWSRLKGMTGVPRNQEQLAMGWITQRLCDDPTHLRGGVEPLRQPHGPRGADAQRRATAQQRQCLVVGYPQAPIPSGADPRERPIWLGHPHALEPE